MAFSDTQKAKIRRYLGYPDIYRDHDPRLESALDVVGGRAEVQALIEADLAALEALETKLTSTQSYGGVRRADDIEFFPGEQIASLRTEGRRFVGRMSITLGVPIASDVFGSTGYGGDGWMGIATQYGGMFQVG